MKRVLLKTAYDGTGYCGFQFQPGLNSIEGELNKSLSALTGEEISVIGASRTDAGVHALGNAAVFDTSSSIPAERFPYALIPFLPPDIRVLEGREVPLSWHPRKQECRKTYSYKISCSPIENPLNRRYMAHVKYDLDAGKMREAAAFLVGEHDFTSFASPKSQVLMEGGSAVRTIYSIEIKKEDESAFFPVRGLKNAFKPSRITITVCGNGFLYNMVRIIAGTLINAGAGLMEPGKAKEILSAGDRALAGPTVKACGLTLVSIDYACFGKDGE